MRLLFLLLMTLSIPALAFPQPGEALADPILEATAQRMGTMIRCLSCAGQNINESNGEMAKALRLFVRAELLAGRTPDAIEAALVARYGEAILFRPPTKGLHVVLWAMPFLLVAGGIIVLRKLRHEP
ncbi:MAG: cytochrome c-type biogenesis protein CcmH [Holosporales bacterium]|jgi:cytochrome c-type biogenesis protein CcmH